MMAYIQGKLDRLVEKMISRKFMAWLTCTGLTYVGAVDSEGWVIVTGIYIGTQAVIDGIAKLKGLS